MKKVPLLIAMFLAFAVVAFAQSDTQGSSSSSQTSSPSATQSSPSSSQGSSTSTGTASTTGSQGSSSSQDSMGSQGSSSSQGSAAGQGSYSQGSAASQGSMSQGSTTKGAKEHKVKGCIRSEGGKYVLEDAHGKTFALNSTDDLSAHVGHEVVVHGTESSAAGSSAASTGAAAGAEKEITVSKLDMVSETCKLGGKHNKSGASGEKGSSTTPPPSQK